MEEENSKHQSSNFWDDFIFQIAQKTRRSLGKSKKLIRALPNFRARPEIFITLGVHGGVLFSDIGYCEFDEPKRVWKFMQKWAKFSSKLPIAFEIGISSLENLEKKFPVWQLIKENNVEVINPLYSQPYLRHLGEESNIRQIKYGLDTLLKNNIPFHTYVSSEHALHPQLPQILKGFGINQVFATVRLGGGSPTLFLPKNYWKGLDKTIIKCLVNQSGIPNGQIWHGKFFQELPHLLFSACSRPDLPWVLFVNIEDVAYNFPELAEIVDNIHEFDKSNIFFSSFSEIFQNKFPFSRTAYWQIEDFPIRLMDSRVISKSRECEDNLINIESTLSLLSLLGIEYDEKIFSEIWRKFLSAQNHDAFIVPFVTPGMYLMTQGLAESYTSSGPTIEKKSIDILEQVEARCGDLHANPKKIKQTQEEVYVNWLWERDHLDGNKLFSLPSCAYVKTKTKKFEVKEFPSKGRRSIINLLNKIEIPQIKTLIDTKILKTNNLKVEIEDHYTYQKLKFHSNAKFELSLSNCKELVITYPFGAQKTSETWGHSHRFYWINKKFVIIHRGCPYYTRNESNLNIHVPPGEHEFGIAYANSMKKAYQIAWDFFYPPLKLHIPRTEFDSKSLFPMIFNDYIPTSIRKTGPSLIIRGFCIGNTPPLFNNSSSLDLNDHPLKAQISDLKSPMKWKILSYLLTRS